MYINSKLVAGVVFLNIAFLVYVYYYFQAQVLYSNNVPQTSNSKEKEYVKKNGEFSHKLLSNTPTIEDISNLYNIITDLQKRRNITIDLQERTERTHYDVDKKLMGNVGQTELRRPELNLSALPPDLYKMANVKVFDLLPKAYLPGYKSPCWMLEGTLKCLPYFYLLGMPKCGTTDLWKKISLHPDIKYTEKEPHWWARGRLLKGKLSGYTCRSKNMVKLFTSNPSLKSRLIIGDGSASTFWDNSLWERWNGKRYEGPKYVTADIMHAAQPDAKLIVILRNPVSRMYSDYLYFNPMHHVKISLEHFHRVVVEVIDRFNKCLRTMSFRGCAYSTLRVHDQTLHGRLLVGLYAVYIRDWLRVYPRDQLKIIRLEDWQENCTGLLPEIFDFLNLEKMSEKNIKQFCQKKVSNGNKGKLHVIGDMRTKTRKLLEDFYEGPNKELSLLLGSDKYLWKS